MLKTVLVLLCVIAPAWAGDVTYSGLRTDFDRSGAVGFSDFFLFADAFGSVPDGPSINPDFDCNGNGAVDFSDFFLFADTFGSTDTAPPTLHYLGVESAVAVGAPLEFLASEELQACSVSLFMQSGAWVPVDATTALELDSSRFIHIAIRSPLEYGTQYSLAVVAADFAGNAVRCELSFVTESAPDTTPPVVYSVTSTTSAITVASSFEFHLSELLSSYQCDLRDSLGGTVDGVTSCDALALQFSPTILLHDDMRYELVLIGIDAAGNQIDGNEDGIGGDPYIFTFRTPPLPDSPPTPGAPPVIGEVPALVEAEEGKPFPNLFLPVTDDIGLSTVEVESSNPALVTASFVGDSLVFAVPNPDLFGRATLVLTAMDNAGQSSRRTLEAVRLHRVSISGSIVDMTDTLQVMGGMRVLVCPVDPLGVREETLPHGDWHWRFYHNVVPVLGPIDSILADATGHFSDLQVPYPGLYCLVVRDGNSVRAQSLTITNVDDVIARIYAVPRHVDSEAIAQVLMADKRIEDFPNPDAITYYVVTDFGTQADFDTARVDLKDYHKTKYGSELEDTRIRLIRLAEIPIGADPSGLRDSVCAADSYILRLKPTYPGTGQPSMYERDGFPVGAALFCDVRVPVNAPRGRRLQELAGGGGAHGEIMGDFGLSYLDSSIFPDETRVMDFTSFDIQVFRVQRRLANFARIVPYVDGVYTDDHFFYSALTGYGRAPSGTVWGYVDIPFDVEALGFMSRPSQ